MAFYRGNWLLLFVMICSLPAAGQFFYNYEPLLDPVSSVDTNFRTFSFNRVRTAVDSVFDNDTLSNVSTYFYDKAGKITGFISATPTDTGLFSFGVFYTADASGIITGVRTFEMLNKDTLVSSNRYVVKRQGEKQPLVVHFDRKEFKVTTSSQWNVDYPVFKFVGTAAAAFWHDYYETSADEYFFYDSTGGDHYRKVISFHGKDTLYVQQYRYDSNPSDPYFMDVFVWQPEGVKTYFLFDSMRYPAETRVWKSGKLFEHHKYVNQYDNDTLIGSTIVYNLVDGFERKELTMAFGKDEIVVTPEVGFPVHEKYEYRRYYIVPPFYPPEVKDTTFKPVTRKKKIAGGYTSVDYFVSNRHRIPYMTFWINKNGLLEQVYVYGGRVIRRSYTYY